MGTPKQSQKTILVSFRLKEIHYLEEQIQQIDELVCCNKNAYSLAVTEAVEKMGFPVLDAMSIFHWNIPGSYYGKSYCKLYLEGLDDIVMYQAEIPEQHAEFLLERKAFDGSITFTLHNQIKTPLRNNLIAELKSVITSIFTSLSNNG